MRKTLVNLVNQKGAGPKNISKQFIINSANNEMYHFILNSEQASYKPSPVNYITYKNNINIVYRLCYYIYFYYYFLPIYIFRKKIERYLAFGNYLHGIIPCKKRLLIHHPYLFDIRGILRCDVRIVPVQLARYFVFRLLLVGRSKTILVVQSESMLRKVSNSFVCSYPVDIIPNPFTSSLSYIRRPLEKIYPVRCKFSTSDEYLKLAYITRFYPHKRFDLLLEFINAFRLFERPFTVDVTVDASNKEFINILSDYPEINNLGEMPQEDLQDVYESADACLYFSDRETFGNTILESLMFGVPIFGLKHDYFTDFITNPLSVMVNSTVFDMAKKIDTIFNDKEMLIKLVSESHNYSLRFKSVDSWVAEMSEF